MPEVKPINVMLVDDTESYCIELAGAARKHRILIQYYDNLETAMEMMPEGQMQEELMFISGEAP